MKRLLSMILAAAMVASMMAPVAYADDTLPITEPTATVQEQPAEDTPAETAPVETPTQEATPAPTETPVEATPAPTAEPAATPEPTEMPTPEPTVEPTTEPTAEPVPTEEPVEIVADAPAEQAAEAAAPTETAGPDDADPETTLILYKDPNTGYYFGKLPVKVSKSGAKATTDCAAIHYEKTANTTDVGIVPIGDDFWVFTKDLSRNLGYVPKCVTYTDPLDKSTGEVETVPLVVSTNDPTDADMPPYMIEPSSYTHAYGTLGTNVLWDSDEAVTYDTDYTVTISVYGTNDEGNLTLDKVTGLGGVEVVSQPAANGGKAAIRYPSDVKYGYIDSNNYIESLAGLCVVAHNDAGKYYYGRCELQKTPQLYEMPIGPNWGDLLSSEGQHFCDAERSWSAYGEVENVTATLTSSRYPQDDMSDNIAVVYDKTSDAVIVNLFKEPDDITSINWRLAITVTYKNGTVCVANSIVTKKREYQFAPDEQTLTETTGSTMTGTLYAYNSVTGAYDKPFVTNESAAINFISSNGTWLDDTKIADYIDATFDNTTGKITFTVKQDIPLQNSSSQAYILFSLTSKYVETAGYMLNVGSVPAPNFTVFGEANFFEMCSEDGDDIYELRDNSYNTVTWSSLGTLDTEKGPSAVLKYNDEDGVAHEAPVTATYNAETDRVNVKMSRSDVPAANVNAALYITFPCKEYTLSTQTGVSRPTLNVSLVNKTPASLGVKAGAVMTAKVALYNGNTGEEIAFPDIGNVLWTGECYDSNAGIARDEVLNYIRPELAADGKISFTVLKDIPLTEQRTTFYFTAKGQLAQFGVSVEVGTPQIYLNTVSGGMTWPALISDAGCDLIACSYSSQTSGWSKVGGTLDTEKGPTASLEYLTAEGTTVHVDLTAVYKPDTDTVNVKMDPAALPTGHGLDSAQLTVTFPCKEWDLTANMTPSREYLSVNTKSQKGLGELGLTAGSTQTFTVTTYDNATSKYIPVSADQNWTASFSEYQYLIELGDGETIADYIKAEMPEDGVLQLTTLKDITLKNGNTSVSVTVEMRNSLYRYGVQFSVGEPSVNVSLYTEQGYSPSLILRKGASYTVEPFTWINGQSTSLRSLGYTKYKLQVVYIQGNHGWGAGTTKFMSDEEAAKYFDFSLKDGVTTITVKEVPKFYDDGSDHTMENCYHYGLQVIGEDFDRLSDEYNSDAQFTMDSVALTLLENGTAVRTLPTKAGTYTYQYVSGDDSRELPNVGTTTATCYGPEGVSVTLDMAKSELTYKVEKDIGADNTMDLSASGMLSNTLGFTLSMPVGRAKIRLDMFSNSYGLTKTNNKFYLSGCYTDGVYLPKGTLKDENFILSVYADNKTVPISQSKYFDATIKDGWLTVTIKKEPTSANLQITYKDDKYVTEYARGLYYSSSSDDGNTKQYNVQMADAATGEQISTIPNGKAGTVAQYRLRAGDNNQSLAQLMGSDLLGFTPYSTDFKGDISDYVTTDYNQITGVLTLTWKQPLPLLKEDGTTYQYYMRTDVREGAQNRIYSISFVNVYGYLTFVYPDGSNKSWNQSLNAGDEVKAFVSGYSKIDDGVKVLFTRSNGSVTEASDKIHAENNVWGGITLKADSDIEAGHYNYSLYGTLNDGAYALNTSNGNSSFTVNSKGNGKDIQYTLESEYYNTWTLDNNGSYSVIGGDTMTLRANDPERVKKFEIVGNLTLAESVTSEETTEGTVYTIQWKDTTSNSEKMRLKATLADGSEATTEVTIHVYHENELAFTNISFWLEGATKAADTSNLLLNNGVWTVGKSYKVYPHIGKRTLKEAGYTLKDAWVSDNEYYDISFDSADGSFTFTPLKSYATRNGESNKYTQFVMTISKNGRDSSFNTNLYYGTIVAAGDRSAFVDADTMKGLRTVTVSASKPTVRLKVDEDAGTLKSVEFKSSVPNSLTMVQDANDPTIVTVTAKQALPYDNSYVTAVITRVDGSQSSAYVQLNWTSSSPYQYLPNGMRMVFGEKGESQDYHEFNGTTWTQSSNSTDPVVKKLYVFFTTYANGATKYYDTLDTVDTLTVTSSDNTNAMVTRQGRENGTYFFEYQLDLAKLGNYTFTATMTATTGETYTAQFELRVCENAVTEVVTVHNTNELQRVLTSATLAPRTQINMAEGEYNGDFTMDVPGLRLLGSYQNRPTLKGTITATAEHEEVQAINFVSPKTGSGTAVTDALYVSGNIFTGYDTAVELQKDVYNSSNCSVAGNTFEGNNTAVSFVGGESYTYITYNTFRNNKTGVIFKPTSTIYGSYSKIYDATINRGGMNHNMFFLQGSQKAVVNQSSNDNTLNMTYNYFATGADDSYAAAKPTSNMFEGKVVYVPFYETEAMDAINTDKTLDDLAKANDEDPTKTKAKLELAAAQGSSNPGGIDSSLTLSGSRFEELAKDTQKAESMEVTVKSTSNETDVIWDFEKDKLKDDYDGSSVNLGVAFTFTDFEQDIVSNVVSKSKEDGTTLNSIAYQAMCFSHSGDLPGEATVKIRMNESLLDYYSKHNNSLDGFKIYYVNEGTGKLEVMRDASGNPKTLSVEVVDGVYFAVTSIDHCSSYLLTPEDLNEAISGLTKILLNAGAPLTLDELTQPDGAVLRLLSHMEPGVTLNKLAQYLSGGSMTVLDANGNKIDADAPLGTGYTIGLGADGKTGGVTVAVAGDLNGDGSVDTKDLTMMRQAILQIGQLTQVQLKAATPSTNGSRVDTNDLVLLRRYLLSMTNTMLD